ncbi:MAG: flagellar type III secretion system pore protein FliP [Myxococcota bacterium]|nr:flagellar type III secretion system pore protein FliP [Myxococcota bacterium]
MKHVSFLLPSLVVFLLPGFALAGPSLHIDLGGAEGSPVEISSAMKMAVVFTIVSLAPALVLTSTCFVRFIVVLSVLRNALGVQSMPPTQVLTGLALFLTVAVMAPVGEKVYAEGLGPYLEGQMTAGEAFNRAKEPLQRFMLRQTRETDLRLFYDISQAPQPTGPEDVKLHLLLPSFVISELRTAFEMGFMLFLPFLLLDIITASVTMAMGMVMVPPALISLPLKIMLFVVADGWNLLVGSLVRSVA